MQRPANPVFLDPSGRRWRTLRTGALVAGVVTTVVLFLLAATLFFPPLLPALNLGRPTNDSTPDLRVKRRPPDRLVSRKAERERKAARQKLFDQLRRHPVVPSYTYKQMSALRPRRRPDSTLAVRPAGDPIVVGFYVNWDDNSLYSLRQHVDKLDWVVAEWGFAAQPTDSVPVRFQIDRRALVSVAQAKRPPLVLLMITNALNGDFDPRRVARIVDHPATRRQAIDSILAVLERENLAGVALDFENIPASLHPHLLDFVRELKKALLPSGRLLTQAVPGDDEAWPLAQYAQSLDKLFLMLYDEHDPGADPGPVASEAWFHYQLQKTLRKVPAYKIIAGIGQYGYEWTDDRDTAEELDFQETIQTARDHGILPAMDAVAKNGYFAWSDPDSTDHIVWYLDAATAYNEMKIAQNERVAGFGIWRLGAEDPSVWSVLTRDSLSASPAALDQIRVGYDVDFQGIGEILDLVATPTLGQRALTVDKRTGLITRDSITALPSTYVLKRYGHQPKKIALTFDDGPDGRYTEPILDTLLSRGVKATFFVIGKNAEIHPDLLRRIYRDGHEIGNHTFTHPNLALTSRLTTRLELTATQRLLEALINRRTTLFRAPYFGDAEPTTGDELVPIAEAKELGYITVGLHIDPDDWATPGVDSIIDRTLDQLDRGNIVLLHDGGGLRDQTVAALGPLIDSVRARGYQFVTVSQLAHLSRADVMVPLPPGSRLQRFVELSSFSVVGAFELILRVVFLVAVALGLARLLLLVSLAAIQRYSRRKVTGPPPASVSVIIPAYREELVINRTIQSILDQGHPDLEVIVVDDGSPDRTFEVALEAFGQHPSVRVLRKPNGGKASALNFGIERARGEVVVALDADTIFAPGTVAALLAPLADPKVGAVAGNAKVGNRINLVTRWQAIEYITCQNVDRRAFALLNGIAVVPGAVGAWRTKLVREVGGFTDDTLAEDQDLTLSLLERGWHIAYADHAIAWTEAPDTLTTLSRQRFRWSFGTLQCAWKHKKALFRPKYGSLGMVALPNAWIFQLIFPFISPVADLLFIWSLFTVYLNKIQHSAEYALYTLQQVVFFYVIFLLVDWLAAVIALWMEPGEEKWLSWLVLLQRFAYRQVMYWVVVRSVMAALRGRVVGWGKLERKATVTASAGG